MEQTHAVQVYETERMEKIKFVCDRRQRDAGEKRQWIPTKCIWTRKNIKVE